MRDDTYVLDQYFMKDKFKLKARDVAIFLAERAGRLASEYVITESALLPEQRKPLTRDLLSRLVERIRSGRYRTLYLLAGERKVFHISEDDWTSLAMELSQAEFADLRGQLVAAGYPRNLIVSQRELDIESKGGIGKELMKRWGMK